MKLAVTDACIFIDLFELDLVDTFFNLTIEVHSSIEVFNEMNVAQQTSLKKHIDGNQLTLHSLKADELVAMQSAGYPKGLSNSDKTVLFLAQGIQAMILSSDKLIRNTAKNKGIDFHGLLWVLQEIKEQGLINLETSIEKITELRGYNFYKNNPSLLNEMKKMQEIWESDR